MKIKVENNKVTFTLYGLEAYTYLHVHVYRVAKVEVVSGVRSVRVGREIGVGKREV